MSSSFRKPMPEDEHDNPLKGGQSLLQASQAEQPLRLGLTYQPPGTQLWPHGKGQAQMCVNKSLFMETGEGLR